MKFRQIGIRIYELNRAVEFYSKLLNSSPTAIFPVPGFAFFDLEGVRLFLDKNGYTGAVYLQVENVVAEINQLKARGIRVVTEPHVVFPDNEGIFDKPGDEWLAFIEDSEGNTIGLMSRSSSY
jgi:methylmalonyl-CoA/ethylmalonyl-CoA epimerase